MGIEFIDPPWTLFDDTDECSRCGRLLPLNELTQVDDELLCEECAESDA